MISRQVHYINKRIYQTATAPSYVYMSSNQLADLFHSTKKSKTTETYPAARSENVPTASAFFEEHEMLRSLRSATLLKAYRDGSPLAIELHQKLCGSLRETALRLTQSSIEGDRRLEAARVTRENLISVINEEHEFSSSKVDDLTNNNLGATKATSFVHLTNSGVLSRMKPLQRQYIAWFDKLAEAISTEQIAIQNKERGTDRTRYGPFLMLLPADLLAILTIQEVVHTSLAMPDGIPIVRIATRIGKAVNEEVNLFKSKNSGDVWQELKRKILTQSRPLDTVEERSRKVYSQGGWDTQIHAKVGTVLLDLLCKTATIQMQPTSSNDDGCPVEPIPAFLHTYCYKPPRTVGIIIAHQYLHMKFNNGSIDLEDDISYKEDLAPRLKPMVTLPKPWTNGHDGGYLHYRTPIVRRTHGSDSQMKTIDKHANSCTLLKQGLNALGRVEWEVNRDIFSIARRIRNEDLQITRLPSPQQITNFEYPDKPRAENMEMFGSPAFRREMKEYRDRVDVLSRKKQEYVSKIMDYDSKLEVAAHLSRFNRFWFPYTVDFRGRCYPIPPVSHLGDDLARAIFTFHRRKPLGERGLYWLKVHLANHMGNDKISFDNRVRWVDEHMDRVLDCADEPIDAVEPTRPKWWTVADNPFQALATIFEIADAVRSPDHREYMSNLPVHQDGSCNGLQHYAALGRDRFGGEKVNLSPSSKPGDVYTAVADKVRAKLVEMAEGYSGTPPEELRTGSLETQRFLAHMMKDQITRKLVKQTVMTSVYGVTFIGARAQIEKRIEEQNEKNIRLKAAGEEYFPILTQDEIYRSSHFVANLTLNAIGDTFRSARDIKEWLKECAHVLASIEEPVSWMTPINLPVIQPYRQRSRAQVRTVLQNVVVAEYHEDMPINKSKQRTAFPPNFVHSLDSSHMILTAIECDKRNINFTAVHDSYWTHAGDIEKMNETLREQFVELHDREILKDLREQFVSKFPQYAQFFPEPPLINDLDIKEVLKSPYFFN